MFFTNIWTREKFSSNLHGNKKFFLKEYSIGRCWKGERKYNKSWFQNNNCGEEPSLSVATEGVAIIIKPHTKSDTAIIHKTIIRFSSLPASPEQEKLFYLFFFEQQFLNFHLTSSFKPDGDGKLSPLVLFPSQRKKDPEKKRLKNWIRYFYLFVMIIFCSPLISSILMVFRHWHKVELNLDVVSLSTQGRHKVKNHLKSIRNKVRQAFPFMYVNSLPLLSPHTKQDQKSFHPMEINHKHKIL